MSQAQTSGQGRGHKVGSRGLFTKTASSGFFFQPRTIILTIAVLWSSLLQISTSNSPSKQPILMDSIFSQPAKLQLRFRPMSHYTASTFTSHVRIPFNYSALLKLQNQMIERMDRCIPDLDRFNFNLDEYNRATLNSTFELYKSDLKQVFNLFKDLLARSCARRPTTSMGRCFLRHSNVFSRTVHLQHGPDLEAGVSH